MDMVGGGWGGEGGMNWETNTETHTLPHVKQAASGKLPYRTGSSAWCTLTAGSHMAVWETPEQHCKVTILQLKTKKINEKKEIHW